MLPETLRLYPPVSVPPFNDTHLSLIQIHALFRPFNMRSASEFISVWSYQPVVAQGMQKWCCLAANGNRMCAVLHSSSCQVRANQGRRGHGAEQKCRRILYSVFLMHRREDLWGPDALQFDPDRFIDGRLQKYLTPNPFIFLPFNAGPRICLGQQVQLSHWQRMKGRN